MGFENAKMNGSKVNRITYFSMKIYLYCLCVTRVPAPAASEGPDYNIDFITTNFKPSFGRHNKYLNLANKSQRQRNQRSMCSPFRLHLSRKLGDTSI
jgi:hypothetical protein